MLMWVSSYLWKYCTLPFLFFNHGLQTIFSIFCLFLIVCFNCAAFLGISGFYASFCICKATVISQCADFHNQAIVLLCAIILIWLCTLLLRSSTSDLHLDLSIKVKRSVNISKSSHICWLKHMVRRVYTLYSWLEHVMTCLCCVWCCELRDRAGTCALASQHVPNDVLSSQCALAKDLWYWDKGKVLLSIFKLGVETWKYCSWFLCGEFPGER